jgi:membrane protein YdbS with pleckstrin-like domain
MSDPEGSSSSSVHIRTAEHQLTRDEIVPVVYRQAFRRWQTWILPIAGICLVVAGVAVAVLNASDTLAWVVMLTLGAAILLIFLVAVPLTPNRIWNRVKKQFEVRTLEITDEGISRHTALNDSVMKWGASRMSGVQCP